MSRSIEDYLPEREPTKPVQGQIPEGLLKAIDAYRHSKDLTWSELMVALFERLLDEQKRKKGT